MAVTGALVGLDLPTLESLKDTFTQALVNGAVRGNSYTIAGRAHTFSTVTEMAAMLNEVNYALGLLTGQRSAMVRPNFNPARGRGRGSRSYPLPATGQ